LPADTPADTELPQLVHISSKVKAVEGFYEHDGQMHNNRPVWNKVASSPMHLFFSANHGKWYISNKFEDNGFTYGTGMALSPVKINWANNTSVVQAKLGIKRPNTMRGTSCPPAYSADRSGRDSFLRRHVLATFWTGAGNRKKLAPMRRSNSGEALSEGSVGYCSTASGSSGVQERRGQAQIRIKTEG
jgi:hypothetical protein